MREICTSGSTRGRWATDLFCYPPSYSTGPMFCMPGLAGNRQRIREAFERRESILIRGLAGAGKTALIQAAIDDLPDPRDIVQLRYSSSLHRLLVDLTRSLLATNHKALLGLARPAVDLDRWLTHQTSLHLKGILLTSLEAEPRTIVLDGVDGGSFPMYRFLQKLYYLRGMTIIAAARDTASLGALSRLFFDPRRIVHIGPLNHADSRRLFDLAANRFGIEDLDLAEFRDKVLESAHGNPRQIIEMCRLAADPTYLSGKHIKFAPVRIEVMMRFLD